MKRILPILLALLGLGVGLGAGVMLKPAPEAVAEACGAEGLPPCDDTATADPFRTPTDPPAVTGVVTYVPIAKPFVVPVFSGERVVAMVVVSVSVSTSLEGAGILDAVEPRLRDSFLTALFRHANSGGFDGSFTSGQKMDDLRLALLRAAREVMAEAPVGEVLITEIARQET